MGSGSSVEETRHSRLFQSGYKALQEGRYTYAEIYYDQAIERHDGHGFWLLFDELIDWEKKSKAGRKKENGKDKTDGNGEADGGRNQNSNTNAAKATSEEGSEDGDEKNMEDEGNGGNAEIIEFPLDSRLEEILEYIQLRTDIADSYLDAGRFDEASPHMEFIFTHTHAAIKYLRIARENTSAEEDGGDMDNPLEYGNDFSPVENSPPMNSPGIRRPRMGMVLRNDAEVESVLDCTEQHLRVHWISSVVNSVYIILERYKGTQGDKKRKKELDAAVLTCMKVMEELNVVARRRAKSLTNAVVLSFLEALIEEMDADSSTTSLPDTKTPSTKLEPRMNTFFDKNNLTNNDNTEGGGGCTDDLKDMCPVKVRIQRIQDRRSLCRTVPAPQQAASLRFIGWMDDEIRRVVPGSNFYLEIQCGMVDEKRKKFLLKRSQKITPQKRYDYNDRVLLGKCVDEENALLFFPVLLIQADVQLELGAATKGIQALDVVDKLATQLYGMESLERHSLMRRVMESRRRGGALFMMFED